MTKTEDNPMHLKTWEPSRLRRAPRCLARTRRGTPCRSPAVAGKTSCRMHGGAAGSGAPKGKRNGKASEFIIMALTPLPVPPFLSGEAQNKNSAQPDNVGGAARGRLGGQAARRRRLRNNERVSQRKLHKKDGTRASRHCRETFSEGAA
jgi:hypothetical protein